MHKVISRTTIFGISPSIKHWTEVCRYFNKYILNVSWLHQQYWGMQLVLSQCQNIQWSFCFACLSDEREWWSLSMKDWELWARSWYARRLLVSELLQLPLYTQVLSELMTWNWEVQIYIINSTREMWDQHSEIPPSNLSTPRQIPLFLQQCLLRHCQNQ